MSEAEGIRLQKVLSQAGIASRRAAEDLIFRGRVEVNGEVVAEQGRRVDPTKDVKDYWEMPTAVVKAATFTGPPAVTVP